ncbi:MarR family transcriptional regulator [Mycobacterium decipiens]|uniref:MarR family transcriptional regulator n=2 Tax=Mycobacterium decipiens TaxID=1430326 RepID=A0A1X2LTV2_9MYCO|nr:MarR family transcriptional regulator [Mycobacterium decipiens]
MSWQYGPEHLRRLSVPNALPVKDCAMQVFGCADVTLDCRLMADSDSTAPDVTELAEGLHRALSKLISILRRGDPSGAAAGDLTLAQLSILVTLLDQGPIRMTDLAAHERVRTPTTTVAIRRLEKIGLVKRSRDPSDLRAVLVDITPQGRAVHGESLANRRAALAAMLSQLPHSDLDTLRMALAPLERLASGEPVSGPASESPARKQA